MAANPNDLAARGLISPIQMAKLQDANQPVLTNPPPPPPQQQQDIMPNWVGSPEDKMRAMNLLHKKRMGEPIHPDALKWLDDYMIQVDKYLPPLPGR
jgi:hypothetical protein